MSNAKNSETWYLVLAMQTDHLKTFQNFGHFWEILNLTLGNSTKKALDNTRNTKIGKCLNLNLNLVLLLQNDL